MIPFRVNATFGLVKHDTARSLHAAISADRSSAKLCKLQIFNFPTLEQPSGPKAAVAIHRHDVAGLGRNASHPAVRHGTGILPAFRGR
jgi:hypothetical protein